MASSTILRSLANPDLAPTTPNSTAPHLTAPNRTEQNRAEQNPANLVELLQWRAQTQPAQRAYTFLANGETEALHITYAELDRAAQAIAVQLQASTAHGDRALLLYAQGIEFITAFLGCLYAGVIAVPVSLPKRSQKATKLAAILANSQAKVALTTAQLHPKLTNQLNTDAFSQLEWIATPDYLQQQAQQQSTQEAQQQLPTWSPPVINPQSLAFLQYTSGSTGAPKGVMVSHGNLCQNSHYIQQAFKLSAESVSVTWLPSFHDMGLIDGIIQPLYTGFLGVLMSPGAFMQKPLRWLQAISHYRATHSGGPNLGYELCAQKITPEQLSALDLSCWESAYSGSEPVRKSSIEAFSAKFSACGFRPTAFYPCYGMAEATLMVSGGEVTAAPIYAEMNAELNAEMNAGINGKNAVVGCGHPHLDAEIIIVDPQQLTPCAPGQVGEVWVSGASVAQGYWNQPELSEQTFKAQLTETDASTEFSQRGPFLRTGDLGFLNAGELFITGRIKDVIILWGRNHYPQDIELSVMQSHPALRGECTAAFSIEVDGIERLVVVQEVERTQLRHLKSDEAMVEEVVQAIRQAVAEQHDLQIHAIALLKTASIHKTSSGKIQRQACKTSFLEGTLNVVSEWTARVTPEASPANAHPQRDETARDETARDETPNDQAPNDQAPSEQAPSNQDPSAEIASPDTQHPDTITEITIQDWLIDRFAEATQVSADDIDIEEPFSQYALDSSVAMSLTGELADWLNCQLEPTLFWEYPNIEILSQFLYEKFEADHA